MTSLERVKATIRFEETDRPPVIPEIAAVTAVMEGISVKEYVLHGEVIARCQIEALRYFGHDAVFAFADLCVEAEALGCRLSYPEQNYPFVTHPVLKDVYDLSGLRIPNPESDGRMPQIIKAVKIMKKELGGTIPVVAHALGPITIASRIMDIEKMLYMIVDRPDSFIKILDFTTEVAGKFILSLMEAGADSIIMFNPSASPSVLPKRIFDEFELPNLKKIFGMIKGINQDIITWYSVAGPIQKFIPSIGTAPIDILTLDYLVPLQIAFEQSGSLCFNGNIKPLGFVERSPDEIRKESLSLLKSSLGRGGFILGSGCEIPPDARKENIKSMVESVYDVGEIETIGFITPPSPPFKQPPLSPPSKGGEK
ncbi:MAG: uroporphyrinogen decarboxylase family protein, partial [Nitrospinae bacterium]|nr:uroporphyrinogen decarboxylase family protein [Nitrospinota bacterium]